tara:strand:- start:1820 stop:2005 length:186 start_codon:yes stop_codon:yes gene_type:complete
MKIGDLIELSFNSVKCHRGVVIKGGRPLGWLEVLFFDGDQMYYDAKDYEWQEKFWRVLNES